jgi:uncharacterized membrane protein YkgB
MFKNGSARASSTFYDGLRSFDHTVITLMRRYGVLALRIALGITFVWFGALKILHVSPVADLVASTVYWFPPEFVVPALGVWEVLVGLGLLTGWAMRLTLLFFFLQMAGTFLVLVMHPDVAFQRGNPLLLTVEGEFVVKNLVLITAGLVVGSTVPKMREEAGLVEMLSEKASAEVKLPEEQ